MAEAKQCDICGELFPIQSKKAISGVVFFDNDGDRITNYLQDLCPGCIETIENVLRERFRPGEALEQMWCKCCERGEGVTKHCDTCDCKKPTIRIMVGHRPKNFVRKHVKT